MKAKIDPDLCTVCMMCVDTVPEVFDMGDDVAEDCPADAIIVE